MDLKAVKRENKRNAQPLSGYIGMMKRLRDLSKHEIKFKSGFNDKNKERFFSETGILLSAGVDLQTVLELSVSSGDKKNALAGIYKKLLLSVNSGSSLAHAMEATSSFNNFDSYSVQIGENTGDLPTIFKKLSIYYSKKITQKRKIISALSYPLVILSTTIGAVFFMLKFVVPMFADTLTQFGGELPAITKFIISISENFQPIVLSISAAVVSVIFLYQRNKHKERTQRFVSRIVLGIPYVGPMIRKSYLVQYTQAMELLLAAHVGITESIKLTQKMINFYPLSIALQMINEDLQKGNSFNKSMEKHNIFDTTMITLVKIGEEVNQLDKIFLELNKQYESELEYRSNILITILEPVMILILAVVIGTILIAMYLPMFKIGTVIH